MLKLPFLNRSQTVVTRNSSPTICPLPFVSYYGKANGEIVACCESQETVLGDPQKNPHFFNSSQFKQLRLDLMAGKKVKSCEKCWINESQGLKSNRIQAWEDYENRLWGDSKIEMGASGSVNSFPSFLELKCGNVCNLKCRMCHPESSHRIVEDREIINKYRHGQPWNDSPLKPLFLFDQLENLNETQANAVRVLQYSGGEPLISREQFNLTTKFAEKYGHQIQLRYSTNLNNLNFEKYDVIELWKKFKKVHVKVSADGIDDVYNYIRVDGNFEKLVENINKLKDARLNGLDLAVGFTTQSYNVFQLPETVDFFSHLIGPGRITTFLLYSPTFMSITNIPDALKIKIIQKLKNSPWDFSDKISVLQNSPETEGTLDRWKTLLQYTREMESKYHIKMGFEYLLNKYLP